MWESDGTDARCDPEAKTKPNSIVPVKRGHRFKTDLYPLSRIKIERWPIIRLPRSDKRSKYRYCIKERILIIYNGTNGLLWIIC